MGKREQSDVGVAQAPAVVSGVVPFALVVPAQGGEPEQRVEFSPFEFSVGEFRLDPSEGVWELQDPNAKGNEERRAKLDRSPHAHPEVLAFCTFADGNGKYAAVVRCQGSEGRCGVPVRKWTSDLHQSFFCPVHTAEARRSKMKAKRASRRLALKGVQA